MPAPLHAKHLPFPDAGSLPVGLSGGPTWCDLHAQPTHGSSHDAVKMVVIVHGHPPRTAYTQWQQSRSIARLPNSNDGYSAAGMQLILIVQSSCANNPEKSTHCYWTVMPVHAMAGEGLALTTACPLRMPMKHCELLHCCMQCDSFAEHNT